MNPENKSILRKITDKVYGGLDMSWRNVILFAVGTAVVTTIFLVVPIFKDTSFERMGVTFEAWIFFAVIIMANCKTPLDSALKTFVFFLISQPLIYLFQVPFSSMGWGLFGYYRFWFLLTLATFPAAYIGWYIRKKNWLSLLILLPVLWMLTSDYIGCFRSAFRHFPHLIVTALFCLGQVLLYLYTFTENLIQKILGFFIPLAVIVIMMLIGPRMEVSGTNYLPDDLYLSENATVVMEQTDKAKVEISQSGEMPVLYVTATELGEYPFSIVDGEKTYHYILVIDENDNGSTRVDIIRAD